LFKSYSLKTKTVEVENWGGTVHIRELSAGAIDRMRGVGEGKELQMAATVIIEGVITEEGKKFFVQNDMNNILEMSVTDLNKVSEAILDLTGLTGGSEEEEE
ncbi:MAG: hypothetical protein GY914_08655, partial [Prochlorococcus sp.]|nr:hypothetical protein [Prochlorococcus sp.]